ncbi:uridine kinase [bacterium]|nr:uridine kinase [bacterium]
MIIGVAGGSGSGKTTVARRLVEIFAEPRIVQLIAQDAYYRDQAHLSVEERQQINYDHPLAFDNDLLAQHLSALRRGESIEQPIYSFLKHTRLDETHSIKPAKITILEGILVLEDARLRDLCDIKVYVDTDSDERFIRRLSRDMMERGRSLDSVIDQYLTSVRPMHLQFVEATKRYADVIIPGGGNNDVAVGLLVARIKARVVEMSQS